MMVQIRQQDPQFVITHAGRHACSASLLGSIQVWGARSMVASFSPRTKVCAFRVIVHKWLTLMKQFLDYREGQQCKVDTSIAQLMPSDMPNYENGLLKW